MGLKQIITVCAIFTKGIIDGGWFISFENVKLI